jgi:hypothetical protein
MTLIREKDQREKPPARVPVPHESGIRASARSEISLILREGQSVLLVEG